VTYALRRSTQNYGGPRSGQPALSPLVLLDGSALARLALPLALELAALAHAELIVLQAVAPSIDAKLRDYPARADPRRALHDQAQQAFDGFAGDGKP
jgi:nucleotide-binding universal stress UspA family protein